MIGTLKSKKLDRPLEIIVLILLFGGFALDLVTPRGYSDWVFYVLALVLAMPVLSKSKILAVATAASVFTVLGFIFSPPGWQFWASVYSRSLGLILIWSAPWMAGHWRRLDERMERANRALKTLSECNQEMVRARSEPQLLSRICRLLVDDGGYRMAWVGYAEHDGAKIVRPIAWAGNEVGYLQTARITWNEDERGQGPTGLAIQTGTVQIARDIHNDPKFAPWREEALQRGYASSMALPLDLGGGEHGALMLYSSLTDAFDPADEKLLTELANDLAFGIRALRARAEQARTEEELRRASAYNRNLLEASLDPLVTINREGKITDANPAAEDVTGHIRNELIGTDFSQYFTDPAKAREAYLKAFAKGGVRNCELEIRHLSGLVTPVLYNASVYRDAEGEIVGVFAIARDVTDKKAAELALSLERQRLFDILEGLPAYVVLLSPDYHVPFANRVFRERFGESGGRRCYEYLFNRTSPCEVCESFKVLKTNAPVEWEWTGPDSRDYQIYDFPFVDRDGSTLILEMGLDVTEGKRAEAALKASEDRYRSVVNAMAEGVVLQDSTGAIVAWNASAQKILGLSADQLVGRKSVDPQWKAVREDGTPFPGEAHPAMVTLSTGLPQTNVSMGISKPDGTRSWISINSEPISGDGSAAPRAVVTTFSDVTERRQAEQRLRVSEEKYRTLFDSIDEGFCIIEVMFDADQKPVDYRFLEVNPSFERQTGIREAQGRTMREIAPQHEQYWFDIYGRIALTGEPARFVNQAAQLQRWYDVYAFRIGEPSQRRVAIIFNDITQHKRSEEALVKLQKAVDASGEVVFMTDRDGLITSVNPEFTRVFGYAAEEVVGKTTPRILKSGKVAADFYAGFWNRLLQKEIVRTEFVNKTKDNRLVNMEVSVNPILDDGGAITGFLAIQRDVTARKQLEEQFRQSQKMEAVGQLAGGVAHDFNNLLTVINGYSAVLLESPLPVGDQNAYLKEILHAGERASDLTQQLLAFSRKQVTQPVVLDLNEAVRRAHRMLERVIGENIRFVPRLSESPCHIRADAGQIEQVMLNLAVNARDAMPQGGTLTIETATVNLDEHYARAHPYMAAGDYVLLVVSDTGCGMDPETQSHIFEPFFTTKGPGKGTGLGLSTVYGIVKQNGGHINVYSEVGKGSTFRVYFKQAEAPVDRETVRAIEIPSRPGTERVLLVEDEPSVRAFAEDVLKEKGYTVLTAESAEEALLLSRRDPAEIHLLLTDVIMPGLNGKELADRLRLSRPAVKVLFISGYTGEAISQHGILDEGVSFLSKPFGPRELLAKVRQTLDAPSA